MDFFIVIAIAAVLALIPTLIYALVVWWLDRYEKEPLPLLIVAFLWGAVPAVILAIALEVGVGIPMQTLILDEAGREFAEVSLVAPAVEESVKAIILVVLFFAYRREFDNVLDGIVYGAMVGLGFAMVENVLYLQSIAFEAGGGADLGAMFTLWILRAGVFGLNHSMFTALMGAALGLARSLKSGWLKGLVPVLGLLAAITFHALHNGLTSYVGIVGENEQTAELVLGACLATLVSDYAGILLVLVLAIVSGVRESRVIRDTLREEVALGRFTPDEYETLMSGRRRWSARWTVLFSMGFKRWRQLGKFFDLATELAFRKHRMADGDPIHQNISARDIARLRQDIDALKMRIISG
ncbi:MAG: PrsW family intramembrane metalloprotease [Chloroflexota bacterium]|nr:PrsW family intramembrane metalloprotease [Chloroflexota bacterium]